MRSSPVVASVIALIPFVHGIAFGGPAPTGTATNADRAIGAPVPETTKGPSVVELRKRTLLDAETCGWVDGDYSSGVTCGIGRTCMLYTASGSGMAGCCDGSDTQDCAWSNECIDYDSYLSSSCGASCLRNSFIRKCTNSIAPYCVTWTYPSNGVVDYGCVDYIAGVETVQQELSDSILTASVSLSVISGNAVTGWDGSTTTSSSTSSSTSAETDDTEPTSSPSSGGNSGTKKGKKVSIALIAGAIGGGVLLIVIVAAITICICIKKKKSRKLAANQAAIAAAQSSRPTTSYSQQKPLLQQPAMPLPPPTPQPYNGYFASPSQQDLKVNPQTHAHEYEMQSPVSNPPTPAPAYVQPYYAPYNAPPMPTQSPAPYPMREPTPGTHEVDAISAPRWPAGQGQPGPVYEMGTGK